MRYLAIRLILEAIARTGLDRRLAHACRGAGVILTMHHVRPEPISVFDKNAGLAITPAFLDALLHLLRELDYEIIPQDQLPDRLAWPGQRPFAVLTFDDGYADNRDFALPILKKHNAPFTMFVCPGFADRTAPLWWHDLEDAVMRLGEIRLEMPDERFEAKARTMAQKRAAFSSLYWRLRALPEPSLQAGVAALCRQAGINQLARTARLCLDWGELRDMAADPLVTIGAHTMTHPRLAVLNTLDAIAEIEQSRDRITAEIGAVPRHFSYPIGDRLSAGPRDYALVGNMSFETAVTTRPGVLWPRNNARLASLPRISVNGLFQHPDYFRTLISGVPLAWRSWRAFFPIKGVVDRRTGGRR